MNQVLVRPIITEKSMREAAGGRFTFEVVGGANKPQIAEAVRSAFGVEVTRVQTLLVKGTKRRAGRKRLEVMGQTHKKAIVSLAKGQKIDLFDVVENPKGSTPMYHA